MKITNHFLIAVVTVFTLTACGGGDSSSSNNVKPTAKINDSKQAAAAISAPASEQTASGFIGGSSSSASPFNLASGLTRGLFRSSDSDLGMQIADTNLCTSGSVTFPPANTNSETITFSDCEIGGSGLYFNGSVGFSATQSSSGFNINVTYNNFTIADMTQTLASLSGTISMSISSDVNAWTSTVSTSGFSVDIDGETIQIDNYSTTSVFDFNSSEDSGSFTYAVTSDSLGGTLIVTTDPAEGGSPLLKSAGSAFPYSGTIIIIGADNNRIRITINGGMATDSVVVEYALDGDAVYDDGIESISWSEFQAQSQYALNPILN